MTADAAPAPGGRVARWAPRLIGVVVALTVVRLVPAWWCGRDAAAPPTARFAGEWALVTHQMIALGLTQVCLAHPDWRPRYLPAATAAALAAWRPAQRRFGTDAWGGEDALASVAGDHGHAYLAYAALALGMVRVAGGALPAETRAEHDALIDAYARRLAASPTGLIDTYPGEAYPTDVAAVAAAIAVHDRATGGDHRAVLARWRAAVEATQRDPASGLVFQRMGAVDGVPHDAPRGSGTALAAYYAGFVDRALAARLTDAVLAHESTALGFGAIREYAAGHRGAGDVDSGPVVLGVSVAATGFALAPARAHGHRAAFVRLFRTTALFGLPRDGGRWFVAGGPIGNALLLAMLTSGPELAP